MIINNKVNISRMYYEQYTGTWIIIELPTNNEVCDIMYGNHSKAISCGYSIPEYNVHCILYVIIYEYK